MGSVGHLSAMPVAVWDWQGLRTDVQSHPVCKLVLLRTLDLVISRDLYAEDCALLNPPAPAKHKRRVRFFERPGGYTRLICRAKMCDIFGPRTERMTVSVSSMSDLRDSS